MFNNSFKLMSSAMDTDAEIVKDPTFLIAKARLSRRLGERECITRKGRLECLHIAEVILKWLMDNVPSQEARVELATVKLRIFEVSVPHPLACKELSEAAYLLKGGDMADPAALNIMGNIHKQRIKFVCKLPVHLLLNYDTALKMYEKAAGFWLKVDKRYEWAMAQKNKAETRCEMIKRLLRDNIDPKSLRLNRSEMIRSALSEIEDALIYRNKESAPFQYEKTIDVKRELEKLVRY